MMTTLLPRPPRVAFQGELGAFSELAIRQQWPQGAHAVASASFEGALQRVIEGSTDFAVIPVENAIIGPVHIARAALEQVGRLVVKRTELKVPVHLCLMAQPGVALESLRTVHSHPAALAQCRFFLARHEWLTAVPHDDTAGAARDVAAGTDRTRGAVASDVAAARYGLTILSRFIEDMPANWTRFLVVSRPD